MSHVVIKMWRSGWRCLGCAFEAFADDLSAVCAHVVQHQERVA